MIRLLYMFLVMLIAMTVLFVIIFDTVKKNFYKKVNNNVKGLFQVNKRYAELFILKNSVEVRDKEAA